MIARCGGEFFKYRVQLHPTSSLCLGVDVVARFLLQSCSLSRFKVSTKTEKSLQRNHSDTKKCSLHYPGITDPLFLCSNASASNLRWSLLAQG